MSTINGLQWLSGAMDESDRPVQWQPDELAAMLAHQLAAPIRDDLAKLSPDLAARYDALDAADRVFTFAELFASPNPSLNLLQIVKDYAKQAITSREGSIPEELGAALYYSALSCAFLRAGRKISTLNPHALRLGLTWALSQSWLGATLAPLFREHLERLNAAEQPGPAQQEYL